MEIGLMVTKGEGRGREGGRRERRQRGWMEGRGEARTEGGGRRVIRTTITLG